MPCGCAKRAEAIVEVDDWVRGRVNVGLPRRIRLFMERKAAQGGRVSAAEIETSYKERAA